ncbi:MAG: alginate lyase, partial [Pseudomonadota bacterium]
MAGDALPLLDEPKAGRLTIQYGPTAATEVTENPPRFTWLPVIDDGASYVLRVSPDPEFPAAKTQVFQDIPWNFFTPDLTLDPGTYHWAYATWDPERVAPTSAWSSTRSFTVIDGIAETPLPA